MHIYNPFNSKQARQNSYYLNPETQAEAPISKNNTGSPKHEVALRELNSFIQADTYPCLAAKASFNTLAYRAGVYPLLADEGVTEGLCHDLITFIRERKSIDSRFTSFLAVFETPVPESELEFEQLLWKQLSLLDGRSKEFYSWNKEVSPNPDADDFSFSFGGQAFFVVGMHPKASRIARRFSYPMLVFNPHEQFEELKAQGLYPGMQKKIRKRDRALQGSINPMLKDFGKASEARQYAGRKVGANWKCPFNHSDI